MGGAYEPLLHLILSRLPRLVGGGGGGADAPIAPCFPMGLGGGEVEEKREKEV